MMTSDLTPEQREVIERDTMTWLRLLFDGLFLEVFPETTTLSQARVCVSIYRSLLQGQRPTAAEVTDHLGKRRSTVDNTITALVDRGVIRIESDTYDGRLRRIIPTTLGAGEIASFMERMVEFRFDQLIRALPYLEDSKLMEAAGVYAEQTPLVTFMSAVRKAAIEYAEAQAEAKTRVRHRRGSG